MRIALLTADVGNSMPNVGDFFITVALEALLRNHQLRRVPMHQPPTSSQIFELQKHDLLVICGTNIVGIGGSIRFAYPVDVLQKINRPVLPIGLGAQADLGECPIIDERGRSLLQYWYTSTGTLSVRDRLTQKAVELVLGKGTTRLTGCPSLSLQTSALRLNAPRAIYCPGPFHYRLPTVPRRHYLSLTSELYQQSDKQFPTLYLAQQPSDLLYARAANPGLKTFYSPMNPQLHLRAIASAQRLLSWRIHPALMALIHHVPAFLIAADERTRSLAESVGLPHTVLSKESTASSVLREYQLALEQYPWSEIANKIVALKKQMQVHLQEKNLSGPRPRALLKKREQLNFACISDPNFFPAFLGLLENLSQFKIAALHCHCLLLGDVSVADLAERYPEVTFHFYRPSDLWPAENLRYFQKLSIPQQAYVSKAALLSRGLTADRQPLFFFDLDLYFFQSPLKILPSLNGHQVLLFPHYNDVKDHSRTHGVYNSGLLLVSRGAEPFLLWWSAASQLACRDQNQTSDFYEQGYLDLAPALFSNVGIYQGRDQNVGAWNLESLAVRLSPHQPGLAIAHNAQPLASFHASVADRLHLFETKFALDQLVTFFSGREETSLLFRNTLLQQRGHWPALDRAVFFAETFRNRLGLPFHLNQSAIEFMVGTARPAGDFFAVWYGRLKAVARKLGYQYKPATTSDWIGLQRRVLSHIPDKTR